MPTAIIKMALRILLLLAIVFGGVFLLLVPGRSNLVTTIIWMALVAMLLASLIRFHSRHTSFTCPGCGHVFMISPWLDAIYPHTMVSKYLKCPMCGEKG